MKICQKKVLSSPLTYQIVAFKNLLADALGTNWTFSTCLDSENHVNWFINTFTLKLIHQKSSKYYQGTVLKLQQNFGMLQRKHPFGESFLEELPAMVIILMINYVISLNSGYVLLCLSYNCLSAETTLQRCSQEEVFLGKGVLKICSKFTEHSCRSGISIMLQNNFIKITLRHGCSPVNLLAAYFQNTFS